MNVFVVISFYQSLSWASTLSGSYHYNIYISEKIFWVLFCCLYPQHVLPVLRFLELRLLVIKAAVGLADREVHAHVVYGQTIVSHGVDEYPPENQKKFL